METRGISLRTPMRSVCMIAERWDSFFFLNNWIFNLDSSIPSHPPVLIIPLSNGHHSFSSCQAFILTVDDSKQNRQSCCGQKAKKKRKEVALENVTIEIQRKLCSGVSADLDTSIVFIWQQQTPLVKQICSHICINIAVSAY